MADFCERLKQLRSSRGSLQKDLAEYLNITVRAYQHYETGTRYPDYEGLQKLADYFDVGIDYLTGRTSYWLDAEGNIKTQAMQDNNL